MSEFPYRKTAHRRVKLYISYRLVLKRALSLLSP